MSFIVNKNSNNIVFKRLNKKVENAFNLIFSKQINEEFDIIYDDYLKLLFHIGFTNKNYSEIILSDKIKKENNQKNKDRYFLTKNSNISNTLNLNDEYQLVKHLWKIITDTQIFNTEIKAKSTEVIIYILNIIENDFDEDNRKEHRKAISNLKNSVNFSDNNLYKNFHLFRKNAINSLLIKDNNTNKKAFSQNNHIPNEKLQYKNIKFKAIDKNNFKIRKIKCGKIEVRTRMMEHNQKIINDVNKQK